MNPAAADRARGCLLAAACGDALGAPFEGSAAVSEGSLAAVERMGSTLRYTDDTALLLTLAEQLADTVRVGSGLDEDRLATAFAETWRAEPWRGYGGGARRVFSEVVRGRPWRQAAGELFGGSGSHGNGGAMRVAPVGLLDEPLHRIAELARRTAAVTHAHPLGLDGAVAQACGVAFAYGSTGPLDPDALIGAVSEQVAEQELREQLGRAAALTGREVAPGDVARHLGHDVSALAAVPAALAAFLHFPDDPAEAVRFAVRVGGDTDTIAAMAGGLAGARCGERALPQAWTARLEDADRLRAAADRLAVPRPPW